MHLLMETGRDESGRWCGKKLPQQRVHSTSSGPASLLRGGTERLGLQGALEDTLLVSNAEQNREK